MENQNSMLPILDDRLYLAASFVRHGSVVADIGTDHAYIPVFLINTGRSPFAIASDINDGPLMRARKNAEKYGVSERIDFTKADGLDGLPLSERGVRDVIICGMGGELIARIVLESEYTKNDGIRLILQPMSAVDDMRRLLYGGGFTEIDGGIAEVGGKIYQCLVFEYTGEKGVLSPAEEFVGKDGSPIRESELFPELLMKYIKKITKEKAGKEMGGLDTKRETALLSELTEIKEKL